MDEAQAKGVQTLIRLIGHCRDMPAALAAADTVVVPAIEPPILGRVVAQAQAMGRPVVTSNVGILPEHVVAPPEMPEEVRTGWVAQPGNAQEFARALSEAFALDDSAYRTMAARAALRRIHVFSAQRRKRNPRRVYDVVGTRPLGTAEQRGATATRWKVVDLYPVCPDPS